MHIKNSTGNLFCLFRKQGILHFKNMLLNLFYFPHIAIMLCFSVKITHFSQTKQYNLNTNTHCLRCEVYDNV